MTRVRTPDRRSGVPRRQAPGPLEKGSAERAGRLSGTLPDVKVSYLSLVSRHARAHLNEGGTEPARKEAMQ